MINKQMQIMKKTVFYVLTVLTAVLFFASCSLEEPTFDEGLLLGKWQQKGTQLFYTYAADYTGKTWDEAEDVTEAEAQRFTWSLDRATLTQIHIMEIGGSVPKTYTVTELNASSLTYEDSFGKSFSFTKVN